MMNKSKIDWCDFSWNPVTGCRHGCEYCYARSIAHRFSGDIRIFAGNDALQKQPGGLYVLTKPFKDELGNTVLFPAEFAPTLHEYRLSNPVEKKKPANIFVCSMADLFGEWVPDEWIKRVFEACEAAPWHNYLFLTKNPSRYIKLAESGILPKKDNFWYGSSTPRAGVQIFWADEYNTFVSIEPILEDINPIAIPVDWVILGAETGMRSAKTPPKREWIDKIAAACSDNDIPFFMKDSKELRSAWGEEPLIREMPPQLQRPEEKPIPHCSECEHLTNVRQGNRGLCRNCERKKRHIDARFSRTSPPWCPRRNEK